MRNTIKHIPSNEDMEFAKSIIDKFGNNVPTSILFDGFYIEYTEYGYTLKGLGMKIATDYLKTQKEVRLTYFQQANKKESSEGQMIAHWNTKIRDGM